MMIDRDSLYRTFYGDRPPPPPWATDCPIRFDVWLTFAERLRTVDARDAARALGTTQSALRKRLPTEFPGAVKSGRTWRIPIATVRDRGGAVPTGTPTQADLESHPPVDVILAVSDEFGTAWLLDQIRGSGGLRAVSSSADPIAAGGYVAVQLTFAELIQTIIPLTNLGRKVRSAQSLGAGLRPALAGQRFDLPASSESSSSRSATVEQQAWESQQIHLRHDERIAHLAWFLRLLAAVVGPDPASLDVLARLIETTSSTDALELPDMVSSKVIDRRRRYPVQSVNMNRSARPAVTRSRITIKADAAEHVFAIDTSTLTWAVVDSGIDATHMAFALRDDTGQAVIAPGGGHRSRVTKTFDLVGARRLLAADATVNGLVDWSTAIPYVEMPPPAPLPGPPPAPENKPWMAPSDAHGTHVAGILAADWPENGLRGICPRLRLVDVRVLDGEGHGDEFSIVAALQMIRHINEQAGRLVVVGVNLSLSVPHDVANHSTGWTPVCVEADRLTRSGVVVVTAAGNAGFEGGVASVGFGYNTVSISDPGNTDSVITVGSTHRSDPHRHGVSYFSSRGPTADGRPKPDLLAPGEDIDGPVPGGGLQAMHGTSQAAAHVSGAAAMLMARHRELIGRPQMVKEILCATATDLRRERAFQGHGLVDALRAIQSV